VSLRKADSREVDDRKLWLESQLAPFGLRPSDFFPPSAGPTEDGSDFGLRISVFGDGDLVLGFSSFPAVLDGNRCRMNHAYPVA